MPRDHVIDPSIIHHQWDAYLEPILAINSGDTVSYDIKVAGDVRSGRERRTRTPASHVRRHGR